MNTKNIFRTICGSAGAAALLLFAVAFTSCSDDDTQSGSSYFRLENAVALGKAVSNCNELGFDVASAAIDPLIPDKEIVCYDIRSNCDWTAECNSEDADQWLEIYPRQGERDGKIRFRVKDNDATVSRSTTVVFRYGNGLQTQATLAVNQFANEPYIRFYVDGADTLRLFGGRFAQTYDIRVASNVEPFYTMPELDWATFTETGNGTFTLDLTDYPVPPTELERTTAIDFKGSGAYASVTGTLDVIQTVAPVITASCPDEDPEDQSLPPLPATKASPLEYTVKCNWDWTIEQDEADDWFSVVPMSGEAGKEYTVKIKPQDNTGEERMASFSILSEEVIGTTARRLIEIMQEGSGGGGAPMTGLEDPVEWFFNGAEGTDYTIPTQQFVEENALKAIEGNGSLSYFHTYKEQTGIDDPDCKRFLGGTGQPYITGAWPGDYWLFSIPVKNLKTGTMVQFLGCSRISGTGQKYWRLEYKEGSSWKAAAETQTVNFNGETITYTHTLPTATPNLQIKATVTYKRPIADGAVQFRFICAANCTGGNAALENPNGGTIRWASSVETGYKDSPVIEVVTQ